MFFVTGEAKAQSRKVTNQVAIARRSRAWVIHPSVHPPSFHPHVHEHSICTHTHPVPGTVVNPRGTVVIKTDSTLDLLNCSVL